MSNYIRQVAYPDLEKELVEGRKTLPVDHQFKFRISQEEMGGTDDKIGLVINYIVDVQPDPNVDFYFQITISEYIMSINTCRHATAQILHEVERYYTLKRVKSILSELTQQSVELLLRFKEYRQLDIVGYIDMLTDHELEAHGIPKPTRRPSVLVTDPALRQLEDYQLIEVDRRGMYNTAIITNLGLHAAYDVTPHY